MRGSNRGTVPRRDAVTREVAVIPGPRPCRGKDVTRRQRSRYLLSTLLNGEPKKGRFFGTAQEEKKNVPRT